jgi:hypothetical protein
MGNTAGVSLEAVTAYTLRAHHFTPGILMGSVLLIFLVFCLVLLCVRVLSSCSDVRYDFRIRTIFGSSLPPVVCLIYVILLCVFTFRVLCCDVRFVFTSSCLSYLRYPIMCLYVPSSVLWCSVRLYFQLFVLFTLSYYVSLRSVFCVVMFGLSLSYLCYLCLLAYSGVHHILCCVFIMYFFVLCTLCCQFLWIVYFVLPLRYSLTLI